MTERTRRAWLGGLLMFGAGCGRAQAPAPPPAPARGELVFDEPGQISSAPLFSAALVDLDHRAAPLLRQGRPLLVNFWARWCGPCKVEIPELVALQARKTGVDVVGIALEEQGAAVRDFARAYEMNYPQLLARDGIGLELMRALGNPGAGLPFTVGIDRRGALVARRLGVLDRGQIDAAVQRLLG